MRLGLLAVCLLSTATMALAQSDGWTVSDGWTASDGWTDGRTSPSPSPSQNSSSSLGCGCSYPGLWLDVILVADSSSSMTQAGLQTLLSYIATASLQMTIGQQVGQVSRLGIVTYSDTATLRYGLTDFASTTDILNAVFNVKLEGNGGSNIEDGIRVALNEFEKNGKGNYSNRKKVIIIAASHYEPGGSTDPQQAAATFRGNGGIIITIEYVQNHGTTVPILDSLASNCSQLTNRNEDLRASDLLDKFCQANCFCSANWDPYSLDQKCYTPDNGCYSPVTIPAAWPLAQRYCAMQNNATLPTVCDGPKAIFMTSLLKNRNEAQWTGLSRSSNGQFTWDDKTPYANCYPDTNPKWLNGTATNGQAVAQLNPSGFVNGFFGAPQFTDYLYTCQNSPCSSTLYCS
ncbi:unnamed protein product, partial [Mesorhabditis belari]|uniref:VWFA domain-containing protein n=1 Tax=Mesorhabditis belari TaxID=2138241 RepID=A0AAF3FEQ9_9BILA